MRYPGDDPGFGPLPDPRMTQAGPGMLPPISEPDYFAEMQGQQEPMPNDFWARMAQGSGPNPFQYDPGRKPTGLEVLLSALAGFANAKAGQGARRVDETTQRNTRAREAAKTLATWRHDERKAAATKLENKANVLENRSYQEAQRNRLPSPDELSGIKARAEAARPGPDDPATKRAELVAARSEAVAGRQESAAIRQERLAQAQTINQVSDDYKNDPDISAYRTSRQNVQTMRAAAAQKSGAGDLALLISYVRATEPGVLSVVRQEELKNVEDAVGKFSQASQGPLRWLTGQRMSPQNRQRMISAGEAILQSKRSDYNSARKEYVNRGKLLLPGVDPTIYLRDYEGRRGGDNPSGAVFQPSAADTAYVRGLGISK